MFQVLPNKDRVQPLMKKAPSFATNGRIPTYTGAIVNPLDLDPKDVNIVDIAHALSNSCRFTGHTPYHYSVAQHSVYVSRFVPWHLRLHALLHDASEAYVCDIARPVKYSKYMKNYLKLESAVQRSICEAFGLNPVEPEEVKRADQEVLAAEWPIMIPTADPKEWSFTTKPPEGLVIEEMTPTQAKVLFLERYFEVSQL